jgi:hypothetical protein
LPVDPNILLGQTVHDQANLVVVGGVAPTGNVSFYWFKDSCPAVGVSGGTAIGVIYSPFAAGPSLLTVIAHPSGNLTPTTGGDYFFKAVYSGDGNYDPDQGVCEPFHVLSGRIIVDKVTTPAADPQVFPCDASGGTLTPYADFSLLTGQQNNQELAPSSAPGGGNYSVKENVPSGWTLTDLSCVVSGTGGSTWALVNASDLTQGVTIDLKAGDTVTCTFVDAGALTTRTQGFWATHWQLSQAVWFGGTEGNHTFPGLSVADQKLCLGMTGHECYINTTGKLMGGFWSGIANKYDPTGTVKAKDLKRSDLDKARMQLLQQLLAAILNNAAFGSSPSGMSIAQAKAAFCTGTINQVRAAQAAMAAFNESGDSGLFTPGISADPQTAKGMANLVYWNTLIPN